jgi:hypothetical protein
VIAVGNNEEEEEFHMVKKSILKAAIMSFAASLGNERDDLKIGAKKRLLILLINEYFL